MQILPSPLHLQTFPSIINTRLLPPKTIKLQPSNGSFTNKSHGRSSIRRCDRRDFGGKEEVDEKKDDTDIEPELLSEIPRFSFSLGKEINGVIYHFITFIKKDIEFVVRPGADGGLDFGLRWFIELKHGDLHLGRGCTLDSSHVYNGKIFLRNGKALIDPLLKWKPTKLTGKESLLTAFIKMLDKMAKQYSTMDKTMHLGLYYLFSCVVFMALILMLQNAIH